MLPDPGVDPSASAGSDWLVVYGSLLRDLPNAHGEHASHPFDRLGVAAGLRRVGPCRFTGALFDLGPYPALLRLPGGGGSVCGELHAILDPGILAVLDTFEGFDPHDPAGSDYLRERIELSEPVGLVAWIYIYNRSTHGIPRVESGDWRAHLAKRRDSPHDPVSSPDPRTR